MSTDAPWGVHEVLAAGPGFKAKMLTVYPGRRLSLQLHHKRAERWVVASGRGEALVAGATFDLTPGVMIKVPTGADHRLTAAAGEPLVIVEVQLGDCDEKDIVRLADDYGRGSKWRGMTI